MKSLITFVINNIAPFIMLLFPLLFLWFWKTRGITTRMENLIKLIINIAPLILLPLFFFSLYVPKTRGITLWLLREGNIVEDATFIFLLLGGIFGVILAINLKTNAEKTGIYIFYLCFSFLLFVTAMEEIAWGQHFLKFETPDFWKTINFQKETTLHNVKGLQHHSEIMRLIFGLGGLLGIWLSRFPNFRLIAPNRILLTWFIMISFHAGIDVYNDYFPIENNFDYNISRTAEFVEMMIGFSGFAYIMLNSKWLFHFMRKDGRS